jgi:hypothetical protein
MEEIKRNLLENLADMAESKKIVFLIIAFLLALIGGTIHSFGGLIFGIVFYSFSVVSILCALIVEDY